MPTHVRNREWLLGRRVIPPRMINISFLCFGLAGSPYSIHTYMPPPPTAIDVSYRWRLIYKYDEADVCLANTRSTLGKKNKNRIYIFSMADRRTHKIGLQSAGKSGEKFTLKFTSRKRKCTLLCALLAEEYLCLWSDCFLFVAETVGPMLNFPPGIHWLGSPSGPLYLSVAAHHQLWPPEVTFLSASYLYFVARWEQHARAHLMIW